MKNVIYLFVYFVVAANIHSIYTLRWLCSRFKCEEESLSDLSIFVLLRGADKQRGEIRTGFGGKQSHYERSTQMEHLLQPCRVRKGCPEEAMSMREPNSWIEVWKMELQMKGGGRMRMEEWPRKSEQDSMWVQQPECESETKAREVSGDQTTQSLCSIGKTNW